MQSPPFHRQIFASKEPWKTWLQCGKRIAHWQIPWVPLGTEGSAMGFEKWRKARKLSWIQGAYRYGKTKWNLQEWMLCCKTPQDSILVFAGVTRPGNDHYGSFPMELWSRSIPAPMWVQTGCPKEIPLLLSSLLAWMVEWVSSRYKSWVGTSTDEDFWITQVMGTTS